MHSQDKGRTAAELPRGNVRALAAVFPGSAVRSHVELSLFFRFCCREDALREELSYMHDVLALRMALSRPLPLPSAASGCVSFPSSAMAATVPSIDAPAGEPSSSLLRKPSPVFSAVGDSLSSKKTGEEGLQETPSGSFAPSLPVPTHLVIPQAAFLGAERPQGDQGNGQRPPGGWTSAPASSAPMSPCSTPSSPLSHSVSRTSMKGLKSQSRTGGGRAGGGDEGVGARPLRREAAMKKLLEVAEESAGLDFGDLPGTGHGSVGAPFEGGCD